MKTKISFIAQTDYANCLTEWSKSINDHSEIFESRVICFFPHTFHYSLKHDWDLQSCNEEERKKIKDWITDSEHIIIAEEVGLAGLVNLTVAPTLGAQNNYQVYDYEQGTIQHVRKLLGVDLQNLKAKLYNFHSGSLFRRSYSLFNEFNSEYTKIFYGPDLYRLSKKRENDRVMFCTYRSKFSNKEIIEKIEKKFDSKKMVISHTPSNPSNKGTEIILKTVSKVLEQNKLSDKFDFIYATGKTHDEIMKIKDSSHICIGEFSNKILNIGGFGVSSIESASLGNVCLASVYNVTEDAIGKACEGIGRNKLGIVDISNDEQIFEKTLTKILLLDKEKIKNLAFSTFKWYEDYLSPVAVCKKIEYELQS